MRIIGILAFGLCVLWPLRLAAGLKWTTTEQTVAAPVAQTELRASFAFANRGAMPVTITDIVTSCGCTLAEVEKKTYAPGESGKIEVVLKYQLENAARALWQTVTVTTDAAGDAPQKLHLHVNVPASPHPIVEPKRPERIELTPQFVFWTTHEKPAPKTVQVRVTRDNDLLRPVGAAVDDPSFSVELRAVGASDTRHFELIITPKDMARPRQAFVTITTNAENLPLESPNQPPYRMTVAIK
ncbi:MAG: DUF1573 domain-containing protein [Opitutae bacterium]|nr:DUF1573 domain-containing protein [Opitutae bacterium]